MEDLMINEGRLLSDKRVIAEIDRHLWIESEKVGYNIGFDKAKQDWLKNFSRAWMEYHMPEELGRARKNSVQDASPAEVAPESKAKTKRRRAKSYFK